MSDPSVNVVCANGHEATMRPGQIPGTRCQWCDALFHLPPSRRFMNEVECVVCGWRTWLPVQAESFLAAHSHARCGGTFKFTERGE